MIFCARSPIIAISTLQKYSFLLIFCPVFTSLNRTFCPSLHIIRYLCARKRNIYIIKMYYG